MNETKLGKTWYLSFADQSGFLGATLARGEDLIDAVRYAHRMGVNPGGEVMGVPLQPGDPMPAEAFGKLMSKADLERLLGPTESVSSKGMRCVACDGDHDH